MLCSPTLSALPADSAISIKLANAWVGNTLTTMCSTSASRLRSAIPYHGSSAPVGLFGERSLPFDLPVLAGRNQL
jgi:hypothetical protein